MSTFFQNAHNNDYTNTNFNVVQGDQYNNSSENTRLFTVLRLASVVDAQYNSYNRYPPPCEPGTRTDVLNKIAEWVKMGDESVCWLFGVAGSGKSAISQSVSECIETSTGTFPQNGTLAATFFFNQNDDSRHTMKRVVATIAYQLTISIPTLKGPICDVLRRDENILGTHSENQLQKLIIEPMRSLPKSDSPLVIVVDALDECQDDSQMVQLVSLLAASTSHLRLRIFITSRPRTQPLFRHPDINLRYDLQSFGPDDAIRKFLELSFGRIGEPQWPSQEDIAALVKKASGLFIYASTAVKHIADKYTTELPHKRLKRVLKCRSYPELDELYRQILSAFDKNSLLDVKSVIGAIVLLREPLSPHTLGKLLCIEEQSLLKKLEKLHSIFSIPEHPNTGRVITFHLSLHEFLTSQRAGKYYIDPSLKEADLAKCCLNCISTTLPEFTTPTLLFKCRCRRSIQHQSELVVSSSRIEAATQYACRYWSSHLCEASPSRKDLVGDIQKFCHRFIFAWWRLMVTDEQYVSQYGVQSREGEREQEWKRKRRARKQPQHWCCSVTLGLVWLLLDITAPLLWPMIFLKSLTLYFVLSIFLVTEQTPEQALQRWTRERAQLWTFVRILVFLTAMELGERALGLQMGSGSFPALWTGLLLLGPSSTDSISKILSEPSSLLRLIWLSWAILILVLLPMLVLIPIPSNVRGMMLLLLALLVKLWTGQSVAEWTMVQLIDPFGESMVRRIHNGHVEICIKQAELWIEKVSPLTNLLLYHKLAAARIMQEQWDVAIQRETSGNRAKLIV